jgi:hypothetical protein
MKRHTLALVLGAAAFASSSASAQDYVSAGVGFGHTSLSCVSGHPCSRDDFVFKGTAGYGLGHGLAVEFGYIDFGKFDEGTFQAPVGEMDSKGFTVAGAFELPLGTEWAARARLGVAVVNTTVAGTLAAAPGGPGQETHATPYYGLALDYAFAPGYRVELALDTSHSRFNGLSIPISALTIGARAEF